MSKETKKIEGNKAINVHLKFSLTFVSSQVSSIMATLHRSSFGLFEEGEVILDALSLSLHVAAIVWSVLIYFHTYIKQNFTLDL